MPSLEQLLQRIYYIENEWEYSYGWQDFFDGMTYIFSEFRERIDYHFNRKEADAK